MMGLDPNLTAGSEYLVSSHRSVAASIYWAGILQEEKVEVVGERIWGQFQRIRKLMMIPTMGTHNLHV